MRVDFRCAYTSVSEHLLHGQKIGSTFKQMSSETVSKGVRTDGFINTIFFG